MIGAAALNVTPIEVAQVSSFLALLEAAKDPKAVKAFFADLQAERDKTREAEQDLSSERAALAEARIDAQAIFDSIPVAEARKAQIDVECAAALQLLSDARADLERREQELTANRADWRNEVVATSAAHAAETKALASAWDALNAARLALSGEQAQLDIAAAEVDALRAQYEAKLAKLRAAVGEGEGEGEQA